MKYVKTRKERGKETIVLLQKSVYINLKINDKIRGVIYKRINEWTNKKTLKSILMKTSYKY